MIPRPKQQKIKLEVFNKLFYIDNLSSKEIAKQLNVTISGLSSFRHRHNLLPRGWANGISPRLGSKMSSKLKKRLSTINKKRMVGLGNPRWRGGKKINYQGYVLIKQPNHPFHDVDGYVREHKIVVEKSIGRILKRQEHIHHLNGIKSDNRLENLVITTNSEHHSLYHKDLAIKALSNTPSHIKHYTDNSG